MAGPVLRMLPLALLDEPDAPARTKMDPAALESLTQSIREEGLIEPLVVRPASAGRFEVIAGHRRLIASRNAGLVEAPCVVRTRKVHADAVKIHENVEREELNPVDEGRYYLKLWHELGEDLERVAAAVKKPLDCVDRRCRLASGDPAVVEALREGRVILGVAEELLKIRDDGERAYYLEYAVRGGCSVRMAKEWRANANLRSDQRDAVAARTGSTGDQVAPAPAAGNPGGAYLHSAKPYELSSSLDERPCKFCGDVHKEWQMYRIHVCVPCADRHLMPLERERSQHG